MKNPPKTFKEAIEYQYGKSKKIKRGNKMITLKQLNEDPKYRKMTVLQLRDIINLPISEGLTHREWERIPGKFSIDKAAHLYEKWKAEDQIAAQSGDMVCRWMKYPDTKPASDKEYIVIENGGCQEFCAFSVEHDNFTSFEGWEMDIEYWLDGLKMPEEK